MKRLTSILAMNHDGIIGTANTLPWRLRTDLAFFKEQTNGSAIIMGRKTFDSLGQRALPSRFNIVLSHNRQLGMGNNELRFAFCVGEGLYVAEKAKTTKQECFVVGGATMYEQFAPFVDRYLITLVDKHVFAADTAINLEMFGDPDSWEIVHHMAYPPSPPADEVSFSIIELRSRCGAKIRRERKEAVAAFVANALRSNRSAAGSRRQAQSELSALA